MAAKGELESVASYSDPVDWLRGEYRRRRGRNRQYSLRAFARQLRMPVGSVSELFSGKRGMTLKVGRRVAASLSLPEGQAASLFELIARRKSAQRDSVRLDSYDPKTTYQEISLDTFAVIAHWYHYAILSLTETSDFDPNPAAIAKRLGISVTEARDAVDRLLRLNLLREKKKGLEATGYFASSTDVPSAALRQLQLELLDRAKRALEKIPVEERDCTSITTAVDMARLPEAKKMIQRFRRRLAGLLNTGNRTEVYHLTVQLTPATRRPG